MALELEAKSRADGAWYHCQVSTCSRGRQTILKVQFLGGDEDYIFTLDEARSRLRPRSKMLQKGECSKLKVGDTVLASSGRMESEKFEFHDAQIRKIHRQRHSSLRSCNCNFEVLWVDRRDRELSSVPAGQVRRVNLCNNIHDHPVIHDWLQSKSKQGGNLLVDTSDAERDVQVQLEEEIDKITMMADSFDGTYSSTTQNSADVATRRPRAMRNLGRNSMASLGRERRQKKAQSSNITRSLLPLDKRPRLSPLAARAALAAAVPAAPLGQARQPILFEESEETSVHSARCRLDSRIMVVARDDSSRIHKDLKGKEQSSGRVTLGTMKRGTTIVSPGHHRYSRPNYVSDSFLVSQWDFSENVNVDLSIDIPIYENLFPEHALNLIIDLPIYGANCSFLGDKQVHLVGKSMEE